MEFKSEFYSDFAKNMQKYDIAPEAFAFAGDIQMADELMFAFNMFLLV